MQENNKKNLILFSYKLFVDLLFLLLITFAFMLIGESIVPGLVSEHISFTKITVAILFDFSLIFWLNKKVFPTKKSDQKSDPKLDKNKYSYIFSLFFFALIAIVIRGFNVFIIAIILILTAIIFKYLFVSFFEKE